MKKVQLKNKLIKIISFLFLIMNSLYGGYSTPYRAKLINDVGVSFLEGYNELSKNGLNNAYIKRELAKRPEINLPRVQQKISSMGMDIPTFVTKYKTSDFQGETPENLQLLKQIFTDLNDLAYVNAINSEIEKRTQPAIVAPTVDQQAIHSVLMDALDDNNDDQINPLGIVPVKQPQVQQPQQQQPLIAQPVIVEQPAVAQPKKPEPAKKQSTREYYVNVTYDGNVVYNRSSTDYISLMEEMKKIRLDNQNAKNAIRELADKNLRDFASGDIIKDNLNLTIDGKQLSIVIDPSNVKPQQKLSWGEWFFGKPKAAVVEPTNVLNLQTKNKFMTAGDAIQEIKPATIIKQMPVEKGSHTPSRGQDIGYYPSEKSIQSSSKSPQALEKFEVVEPVVTPVIETVVENNQNPYGPMTLEDYAASQPTGGTRSLSPDEIAILEQEIAAQNPGVTAPVVPVVNEAVVPTIESMTAALNQDIAQTEEQIQQTEQHINNDILLAEITAKADEIKAVLEAHKVLQNEQKKSQDLYNQENYKQESIRKQLYKEFRQQEASKLAQTLKNLPSAFTVSKVQPVGDNSLSRAVDKLTGKVKSGLNRVLPVSLSQKMVGNINQPSYTPAQPKPAQANVREKSKYEPKSGYQIMNEAGSKLWNKLPQNIQKGVASNSILMGDKVDFSQRARSSFGNTSKNLNNIPTASDAAQKRMSKLAQQAVKQQETPSSQQSEPATTSTSDAMMPNGDGDLGLIGVSLNNDEDKSDSIDIAVPQSPTIADAIANGQINVIPQYPQNSPVVPSDDAKNVPSQPTSSVIPDVLTAAENQELANIVEVLQQAEDQNYARNQQSAELNAILNEQPFARSYESMSQESMPDQRNFVRPVPERKDYKTLFAEDLSGKGSRGPIYQSKNVIVGSKPNGFGISSRY